MRDRHAQIAATLGRRLERIQKLTQELLSVQKESKLTCAGAKRQPTSEFKSALWELLDQRQRDLVERISEELTAARSELYPRSREIAADLSRRGQ